MIVMSTPSSITWQSSDGKLITFKGEWTLEPKFYLTLPLKIAWDDTENALSAAETKEVLNDFLQAAENKGWTIEIETET
jgi:hypothetical protein